MKTQIYKMLRIILLVTSITACGPNHSTKKSEVTGKGNGGNGLAMSEKEIKSRVDEIKPNLLKLFEGLKNLVEAESQHSGATDLSEFKEVHTLLQKMFENSKDVFTDIQTKNNFDIGDKACVDDNGFENVAAAHPGQINGLVCVSISELRKISPKGAKTTTDILMLAILAHEFGHHYLNSKTPKEDETLLRTLQAFVNYELQKFESNTDEGSVSTTEMAFLDRFLDDSKSILDRAKSASSVEEKK